MVFQKGGFASISSAANGNNEKLSLGTITVDEPGYIYVYVSNESNSSDWVYFDDLKVTVTESPLVQVADYYPYGMSMSSSWQKASTADNRYLFNGGAEKEDNTGLYYTAFRRYDPGLGRFHTIDPLAESMASLNPYHYANNNPVFFNDPDGLRPIPQDASEEDLEEYTKWMERWFEYYHFQNRGPSSTRRSNTGPFRSRLIGPGSGNHWSDKFSSPVRDYFLMSATGFEEKRGISASEFSSLLKSRGTPTQNQHGQWGYETMVFDGNHLAGFMPGTSNAIVVDTYRPEFVALGNDQANGGMTDFTNSNHALNIGAGIYGAMEGATASQGYWLGKNGKYYEGFSGRGPNQYTGSRAGALKAANTYKLAGKAVVLGQVVIGGISTYEGYIVDGGEFGYNAQRAAVGSAAGIGFGLAGAKLGAATGAAIGAWFGGVGAVPGAVIGGVIGGFGLGVSGSYLGSYLGESVVDHYHGR